MHGFATSIQLSLSENHYKLNLKFDYCLGTPLKFVLAKHKVKLGLQFALLKHELKSSYCYLGVVWCFLFVHHFFFIHHYILCQANKVFFVHQYFMDFKLTMHFFFFFFVLLHPSYDIKNLKK